LIDRPLPPELIARFDADLAYDAREAGLGLAVSGGPDSLALLLLTASLGRGRFAVATVDHGLRPESAAEARLVADVCARLAVPHTTLSVTVEGGNLQARAREARYDALARWAREQRLGAIATAHHADDQAETLLMRLNRGSGVAGLAGVRRESYPFGDGMALVRPLLGWRKAELEALVSEAGLAPVRDSSNDNPAFDRVRVRELLALGDFLDPVRIARSAEHLAQADTVLWSVAAAEWDERVESGESQLRYRPNQPAIIRYRVIERAIRELGGTVPRGSVIAQLDAALEAGGTGNAGGILARLSRGVWVFSREPERRG